MRITRRVFHDLAIWMVFFGIGIGIVFPFFVMLLGVPRETALTTSFIVACLVAGALAGIVNYTLAKLVVGRRLRVLALGMSHVESNLDRMTRTADIGQCTPENCRIPSDSDDEIGESANAFNSLVDALAASIKTQAAIRSFSEMLAGQLALERLADQALRMFFEFTGAIGGAILYEMDGELRVAASIGLREAASVANSDHVKVAIRTGLTQVVSIPDDVRVEAVLADFRPTEVIVYPVTYHEVPLGVVVLAASTPFQPEQRSRIELFSNSLSLALNNALAHDRLQRLAALDPLTGVYNRRFGLGRLREEFGRAVRATSPLGVLMMDIDHFKNVNDTYGHLIGDRVLKALSGIARSSLREGDVLLRHGGEEFMVVLPGAAADDVRHIAERIRKSVEEASVTDGDRIIKVTISLGGAAYPRQNVENEEALVRLADEALYRAKQGGRNRVVLAT